MVGYADQFFYNQPDGDDKTCEKAEHTHRPEKMHRPLTEFTNEENRQQIQKSLDEPAGSEFCFAVFSWVVQHHLLTNARKPGPLGDYRDIAMHLAVHLDTFYHVLFIGF